MGNISSSVSQESSERMCEGWKLRVQRAAESQGRPIKERQCLRHLQRGAARAVLQTAAESGVRSVHHPATHVPSPLLFIYTLRGWMEFKA